MDKVIKQIILQKVTDIYSITPARSAAMSLLGYGISKDQLEEVLLDWHFPWSIPLTFRQKVIKEYEKILDSVEHLHHSEEL